MISKEALEKFKTIYREKFGKEISDKDALESATKLLTLVDLIYKPMTKKDFEMLEERKLDWVSQKMKLSSGEEVRIRKFELSFNAWKGEPVKDSYGGKTVIDCDGEPLFAELAVLRTLQKEGWQGAWVDSYRKKFRVGLPGVVEPIDLLEKPKKLFDDIAVKVGGFKGCWDVFAWKEEDYLFLELKRESRDFIGDSQIKWLEASLDLGVPNDSFAILEWKLDHPVERKNK